MTNPGRKLSIGQVLVEKRSSKQDRCAHCSSTAVLPFAFTFAFQPIVDMRDRTIFSYEALVRGPEGESAAAVLAQVNVSNRYRFDQACRVNAIRLAAQLGMRSNLNINFMPNAVYRPENCIRTTFAAAEEYGFPIERIVFETIESDELRDTSRLVTIMREYHRFGFMTAVDDFGAGYHELNALAAFQPDIIKIDIELIRGIESDRPRQAIVRAIIGMCADLGIRPLAEGVETLPEYRWLSAAGIELFQGYLFARPAYEALPLVDFAEFRLDGSAADAHHVITAG